MDNEAPTTGLMVMEILTMDAKGSTRFWCVCAVVRMGSGYLATSHKRTKTSTRAHFGHDAKEAHKGETN